jgi:hypothetical protein
MLKRFNKEVLRKGGTACLPTNLNDEWLDLLAEEMNCFESVGMKPEEVDPPSCCLAAVFTILLEKSGSNSAEMELDALLEKLSEYGVEIGLETVHRRTDMSYIPATLESIFSNRKVTIWKKEV